MKGEKNGKMLGKPETPRKDNIKINETKNNMPYREYNVVDTKACQDIIESEILFGPPEKDRVIEIIKVKSEFDLKKVEVSTDMVRITGCIHKGILYKTIKAPDKEGNGDKDNKEGNDDKDNKEGKDNKDSKGDKDKKEGKENKEGNDDKDNKEGKDNKDSKGDKDKKDGKDNKGKEKPSCKTHKIIPKAVDGVVRHTTVWIPFRGFIVIKGAQPGDICEVLYCELAADYGSTSEIKNDEDNNNDTDDSVEVLVNEPHYINGILAKDLLRIGVRVKSPLW